MNFFKKIFKTDSKPCAKENKSCRADKSAVVPEALLPTINFELLKQAENSYMTTRKVAYKKVRNLKDETIDKVFEFAYTMAFDEKHRKKEVEEKSKEKTESSSLILFKGNLLNVQLLISFTSMTMQ